MLLKILIFILFMADYYSTECATVLSMYQLKDTYVVSIYWLSPMALNGATINILQMSPQHTDFNSFASIPSSDTARSYGSSMSVLVLIFWF